MSPNYKLNYYDGRGLGEIVRLLFAHLELEFEDNRMTEEQWQALKPTTPFGKIPTLEFDGIMLSESRAIARYIARENGLAGDDNLEAAQCDMLVDAFYDVFYKLSEWYAATDVTVKADLFKIFATDHLPPFMAFLTKYLTKKVFLMGFMKKYDGKGGDPRYFVGVKLTWADIAIAAGLHNIDQLSSTHAYGCKIFENSSELLEHVNLVLAQPNLKKWMDKRPKTDL